MGIHESQLITWSHQGATVTSQCTHENIRSALTGNYSEIKGMNFDLYLQGSYKNSTNIRGNSDVDLVVQYNGGYYYDISHLSLLEKQAFEASRGGDHSYSFTQFHNDVRRTLMTNYGDENVKVGNKSIKLLKGSSNRLEADVIPCYKFLKFTHFKSWLNYEAVEGIKFFTSKESQAVINFPKLHHKNGAEKNNKDNTNGLYKPMVRIFKNARSYMRDRSMLANGIAPSYFLESLLYNVPNQRFVTSKQQTIYNILDWLYISTIENFVCQNQQLYLFGDSDTQWNVKDAKNLIAAYIKLWNEWGK